MPQDRPHALVMTAAGINCDAELAHAFGLAGARVTSLHLHDLMRDPHLLDEFDLIGLPGGFSYGDAIAAGRIAAAIMRQSLWSALTSAVGRGVPIIAPCNGFQIAVQLGLLPGPPPGRRWPDTPPAPTVALAQNEAGRFADRWCRVEAPPGTRCIWTRGLVSAADRTLLPIAHGEGRFIASDDLAHQLDRDGQIALRYHRDENPNGSAHDIAGICDATGLVFGVMPHPERFTSWLHYPGWARLESNVINNEIPFGLRIFQQAVAYVAERTSHAAGGRSLRAPAVGAGSL